MNIVERAQGIQVAEQLATEIEQYANVKGVRGTLVGALYDAWHVGKYGKRPEPQPEDVVDDEEFDREDDNPAEYYDRDAAADRFQSDLDRAESLTDLPF